MTKTEALMEIEEAQKAIMEIMGKMDTAAQAALNITKALEVYAERLQAQEDRLKAALEVFMEGGGKWLRK